MLYVGTSGWWYDDWRGIVYPDRERTDPLTCLARLFNALEINVSFYRDVAQRMAASWLRRIDSFKEFRFTAKLHQRFTHQRQEPFTVADVKQSLDGLEPIREAGRLGALLAQFPWAVRDDATSRVWIERVGRACVGHRVVVELRHDSWLREESLTFLRSLGIGMCNIDMPVLEHCVPPTEHVLSPVAYVRLHGRNYAKWWKHDHPDQRYDYMYTESEVDEWVARTRRVADHASDTFVFTNNHFRGHAPANALQMKSKLAGAPVEIPPVLLQAFPELHKYGQSVAVQRQGELFR